MDAVLDFRPVLYRTIQQKYPSRIFYTKLNRFKRKQISKHAGKIRLTLATLHLNDWFVFKTVSNYKRLAKQLPQTGLSFYFALLVYTRT